MAILFIDDDETGRTVAGFNLRKAGYEVDEASDGIEGLRLFDPERHEVVVTDLKMPGIDGMTVLATIGKSAPDVPVVVITAFGNVDRAVKAMRAGAWDFISKPFSRDQLELTVQRACEASRLRHQNRRLVAEQVERSIVAVSKTMRSVLELVDRVAPTDASVLVTGESGVGKELIARRVHGRSRRAAGPFVAISCAAIPAELLESELFGHTKGAFTGAGRPREGRFRKASGGTLFLDEIGEMPAELQVKLLRVLQEGEVDIVGSDAPVKVDVRLVAATNQDIEDLVDEGKFREDLFYRLNVIRIDVPSLRDRPDDIGRLVEVFVAEFAGGRELAIPKDVLTELRGRKWGGNVRELRNVCERLAILAPGGEIRSEDLPAVRPMKRDDDWLARLPEGLSLFDVEREVIAGVLRRHDGNVSAAARALKVPRHILAYRIEKHGIDTAS